MKTQESKNQFYIEGYDIISLRENLRDHGIRYAISEDWRVGAGKKLNSLADLIRKAGRIDLTTGLFERTLSERDMEGARLGFEIEEPLTSDSKFKRKYSKRGDNFVIEDTTFSFRQIVVGPHEHGLVHRDFYPDRKVTSVYDASGKLKERKIRGMYGDNETDWNNFFVVTFNPPGRIIGQRERCYKK